MRRPGNLNFPPEYAFESSEPNLYVSIGIARL